MYWVIFSMITLLIVFFFIGVCVMVKSENDAGGPMFIALALLSLIMWGFIEGKTYTVSDPKDIKPKEISILKDKEVVILRYRDFQETYISKKEYDAISDSTFVLQEITEYNIQGEDNGKTYKLIIE